MSDSEMRKLLLILSVLLASGAVSGARTPAPEALGTVQYEVRYKLGAITSKVATASVSLEKGERDGQPVYYTKATVKTTPVFRLFLGADCFAEAWMTRSDLSPLYYVNPLTKKGFKGIIEYDYDAGSRTIRSLAARSPQDSVRAVFPLDGRTKDLLTLLQDVRFRDFPATGAPEPMHVLLSGQSVAATLSCVGPGTEMFPDRETDHIVLRLTERGMMENGSGNEIHVWRSREADRRILRLEAALSSGFMYVTIQD